MPPYDLSGRAVAITGSTGGLGVALSAAFRSRGAAVALLDLDGEETSAQADSLGGESVARGWEVDVRDLSSLETAMGEANRHFGRLDVAVACAGIDMMAPVATIDPSAFYQVLDVNVNGVWRTLRAALPYVSRHRGYLLAISSMAAFVHSPLQGPYAASKAAVWALCDSLRLEVRHLGVAVGSAHPTFFRTPLMDDVLADPAGRLLWNGNDKGLWKMASIETVTTGIVRGVERRAEMIVAPRSLWAVARAPGLFRHLTELVGFRESTLRRAIGLASSSGWNDQSVRARQHAIHVQDGRRP